MCEKTFVVSLWQSESHLRDGFWRHRIERCRASQLEDVMFQSSSCHINYRYEIPMPTLVELDFNIVEVWPLTVPLLKETGKKHDGDSLVAYHTLEFFLIHIVSVCLLIGFVLEQRNRWLF